MLLFFWLNSVADKLQRAAKRHSLCPPCVKGGVFAFPRKQGDSFYIYPTITNNLSVGFADSSLYTREPFTPAFSNRVRFHELFRRKVNYQFVILSLSKDLGGTPHCLNVNIEYASLDPSLIAQDDMVCRVVGTLPPLTTQ